MRDISLLVADDEALARAFIRKILAEEEAPVSMVLEASNGLEAVELAITHGPDLALLDIRMPGLDGLKAAERILAECPGTSVAIITAYDDFDYARTALRAGVSDYLLKPVRPEDVLKLIADSASKPGADAPAPPARELPPAIRAAVDHVLANLAEPLDLHQVAKAAFVSPHHLSHLFPRHMGRPLSGFIQEQRLAKARDLLSNTSLSISDVAEQTGFSTLAYFSACFKKRLGMSPSQYRRETLGVPRPQTPRQGE